LPMAPAAPVTRATVSLKIWSTACLPNLVEGRPGTLPAKDNKVGERPMQAQAARQRQPPSELSPALSNRLETVEYAIIAGLIVVSSIVTIVSIGTWVSGKFSALNAVLAGGHQPRFSR
jgi:Flp pilus assembly pilin Flp